MTDNIFTPPSQKTRAEASDLELATVELRLGAKIVDWALWVAAFIPCFVLIAVFGGFDAVDTNETQQALVGLSFMLCWMALVFVQWAMLAMRAQTVGKWLMGIHIRRLDGSWASWLHTIVLREFIVSLAIGFANVCCLGPLVWAPDVLMGLRADRRCAHDHLAETKVVTGHPPEAKRLRV